MSVTAAVKAKGAAQFGDVHARFVNNTPKGEKKDFSTPMADAYDPGAVEASWDAFWEAHDLYKPDESKEENFVIVLPPPNVTGSLHLGHALTVAIQDSVVRWHRMNGKATLWVPGLDHAGIATQVVVEKQIARTLGKSRHDLGREAFVEAVWEWKEQFGGKIEQQVRTIGASVDWSRHRFTMDDMCAKAVLKAFLTMHERKLIYRANRIVSWSCALRSAISSVEVDHVEVKGSTTLNVPGFPRPVEVGVLHSFAYKVAGSETGEEIVVATTRIETMLGDVAVAVYPGDERYKHLVGKRLVHPFIPDRVVVVVEDAELVKPEFGTGAVKITPAHDQNDFLCGERNSLPRINILDDRGYLNANAGEAYAGLHRYEAREKVIADLQAAGLYRGKEDNAMSVGICSRSGDIVEPIIRPQWWVKCGDMAARAADAARTEELSIIPSSMKSVWYRWLDGIQDWCISRQLWWGHRIPAYYVQPTDAAAAAALAAAGEQEDRWVIAATREEAEAEAAKRFPGEEHTLEQDPDVLDTWFSSGLFPFSVMGWPEETADFKRFFPGNLLETGSDIIFFWVARMVMMSLELTGKLPFSTVYLHTLVRDKVGQKMSKSLGNVIDPLQVVYGITLKELQSTLETGNLDPKEVARAQKVQAADFPNGIPQCGADALRFGLLSYTSQGGDINLDPNRLVVARTFCNKVWQATRFALRNFSDDFVAPESLEELNAQIAAAGGATTAQAWVLSRLHHALSVIDNAFTNYVFGEATEAITTFFVDELCSRYLEMIKPVVKVTETSTEAEKLSAQAHLAVLFFSLDLFLRALHPIMPFVTEELWHRLPGHAARVAKRVAAAGGAEVAGKRVTAGSIMVAPYPVPSMTASLANPQAEADMALITTLVGALRSSKNSVGLTNAQRPDIYVIVADAAAAAVVAKEAGNIATLGFVGTVTPVARSDAAAVPAGCMTIVVNGEISIAVVVAGLVDIAAEVVKAERKYKDVKAQQDALETTMNSPAYANCKPEIREKNAEKHASNAAELASLAAAIENFNAIVPRANYLKLKIADVDTEIAKVVKNLEKNGVKEADINAPAPEPEAGAEPEGEGAKKKKPSKAEVIVAGLKVQYNALQEQKAELKTELDGLSA